MRGGEQFVDSILRSAETPPRKVSYKAHIGQAATAASRRMPDLCIDGHVTWKPDGVGIFGPARLPVLFTASCERT